MPIFVTIYLYFKVSNTLWVSQIRYKIDFTLFLASANEWSIEHENGRKRELDWNLIDQYANWIEILNAKHFIYRHQTHTHMHRLAGNLAYLMHVGRGFCIGNKIIHQHVK